MAGYSVLRKGNVSKDAPQYAHVHGDLSHDNEREDL
jgi:hypothetical protein